MSHFQVRFLGSTSPKRWNRCGSILVVPDKVTGETKQRVIIVLSISSHRLDWAHSPVLDLLWSGAHTLQMLEHKL
jgi:hypothetical protein